MNSRLLNFSLGLNLILLALAGYWTVRNHTAGSTQSANGLIEKSPELTPLAAADTSTPAPLRWNELESKDYPTYVANLRKAGCPEPVLRRIIVAEVKELYAQKGFVLAQEFNRDFWEIAARKNIREYFETTLGPQFKTFGNESDALLKLLVGEAPREISSAKTTGVPENRFTDFLSPVKQEQLRQLTERYEAQLQTVRQANLSPEEKTTQLGELRREMEGEQRKIISPKEWDEYQLRQSGAANELQQLYGVDFNETELRNLATAIDDYNRRTESEVETDSDTLDQKLQSILGAERFADLNRARSASYRELYEVASDFGLPGETAAEVFNLRLASEKRSDAIRADKNRTTEEKQTLLDNLQEQVEQTVFTKFGAGAYQSYKAKDGRWLNSLGRL